MDDVLTLMHLVFVACASSEVKQKQREGNELYSEETKTYLKDSGLSISVANGRVVIVTPSLSMLGSHARMTNDPCFVVAAP